MSHCLTPELSEWLERVARRSGVPQGRIIRDQLEKARGGEKKPFMRLAGAVSGPQDLSLRKGFSKK